MIDLFVGYPQTILQHCIQEHHQEIIVEILFVMFDFCSATFKAFCILNIMKMLEKKANCLISIDIKLHKRHRKLGKGDFSPYDL